MESKENDNAVKLYDVALQTRNLEISLFWQRSNYFLVLSTAVAVGYFTSDSGSSRLILALLGAVSAILWVRVCAGSKFWQSRWEERLRVVEKQLYPTADFFAADWKTIRDDVRNSLNFSGHSGLQAWFDELVLRKPSVSMSMMVLAVVFVAAWFVVIAIELLDRFHIDFTDGLALVISPTPGEETMNASSLIPVLLALQFAAFGWRIAREISIEDQGRMTWLPLPDYLNLFAMLSVIALAIVWPIHTKFFGLISQASVAGAAVLIGFHPISMAAHYRLFSRRGRRVYEDKGRDYPWVTGPEIFAVLASLVSAAVAITLAVSE